MHTILVVAIAGLCSTVGVFVAGWYFERYQHWAPRWRRPIGLLVVVVVTVSTATAQLLTSVSNEPNRSSATAPTIAGAEATSAKWGALAVGVHTLSTANWAARPGPAYPGLSLSVLVEYRNLSRRQQDNVVLRVRLPNGLSIQNGSTILGNSQHPAGVQTSDGIASQGINVGSYGTGGNAWVIFDVHVGAPEQFACGDNGRSVTARAATGAGLLERSVALSVTREC